MILKQDLVIFMAQGEIVPKRFFWNIYDFESKLSDIDGIIRGSILHLFFEIFMVLKQDLVILMAQGET